MSSSRTVDNERVLLSIISLYTQQSSESSSSPFSNFAANRSPSMVNFSFRALILSKKQSRWSAATPAFSAVANAGDLLTCCCRFFCCDDFGC